MGLTFLTPLILGGAALVAVPVVLHLIMRRQPKHLMFPALRFIQKREEANRRRLKLRHILLLLLRCLAILLLAFALSRPSLKSASGVLGDQEAPIAAAFVFDTAAHMEYRHENKTRLALAQETADWLLPQLPADSEIAVVESSRLADAFAVDNGAARQRIGRLAIATAAQPFYEVLNSALQLVNDSDKQRKEAYVFTDLSKASWPADGADRFRARLEKYRDVAIYIIDVGVEDPRDFALGNVDLSAQIIARQAPVTIGTFLSRIGPGEERMVELYMLDPNGKREKRDQRSFNWQPGNATRAEFTLRGLDLGTHQGFLQIVGDDALPANNIRYFTVEVHKAWPVLIAASAPVADHARFLSEALSPQAYDQGKFDVTAVAFDKLATRPLEQYSAICLLDPPPLDAAVWEKLYSYVEQGGGLSIFLGQGALTNLQEFNSPAALKVLPGALLRQARSTDDLYLAPLDLRHPALAGFSRTEGEVPWRAYPVYKYWQFEKLAEGVNTIIPFNNDKPALVEQHIGRGTVLTMTTPISERADDYDGWNQIATGFNVWPAFVLVNEATSYLVGSASSRLNYLTGESVILQIPEEARTMLFSLRMPDDISIPQTIDQKLGTLTISSTNLPGNYQLQAGGTDSGVSRGFTANIPASATELERVSKETLDQVLGEKKYRLARNQEEITRDVSLGRVGVELYPLLILLVALALGTEQFLSNRFYRRDNTVGMDPKKSLAVPDSQIPQAKIKPVPRPELAEVGAGSTGDFVGVASSGPSSGAPPIPPAMPPASNAPKPPPLPTSR
ncbi:MAG: BatA domain-containing protein [Planctomycetota bacterium]|nr:BatA domain-containing protein [Planctomycetota bacterium]